MRLATILLAIALVLAASGTARAEDTLYTADGYAIGMTVSPSYPLETAAAVEQSALATLNGLPHGSELAWLHVLIETPAEVVEDCGGDTGTLACYGDDRIVLPGEQIMADAPVPFILAHEYAHHVLAHRRNDPWFASDWGPKRWASVMRVCPTVRSGQLFLDYWTIPAEAFAESYAAMLFPEVHWAWGYDRRLMPTDAARVAIRADVMQPWQGPTIERVSGRLARGAKRVTRLALPLDGDAKLSLRASRPVELTLLNGHRTLATAHGRRPRVTYSVCGQRRVTLRLRALAGATTYRLTTSRP
jgi:hypothetical protein